jgi:hypothetical protein
MGLLGWGVICGLGGVLVLVLWILVEARHAHKTARVCKTCRHHRSALCHWSSHVGDPLPALRYCGMWERRFTRP